ncbi:MAG: sigma-70 family RNA polymerase sigma factor [bacterium]|nr:sigma-70 family RNA polymerase sigma factor [bacterium]
MKKYSDKELIRRCLKNKADAQRMLYEKHSSMVYTVCYRYAKNAEDANDLLQETFIKVFSNLEKFSGSGSFEGWVRRIAVNSAIRHYQNSQRRIDDGDMEYSPDAETYADAIDHLSAEEIMHQINRLPDGYRIVFNMYAIEGYSHKEIAEHLNISESASRSQLTRARAALMEMVGALQKVGQG